MGEKIPAEGRATCRAKLNRNQAEPGWERAALRLVEPREWEKLGGR